MKKNSESAPPLKDQRKAKRGRIMTRLVGAWFTLIGGIIFVAMLRTYLDPTATILVNGVPTTDPETKLFAVIFASIFVVIGVVLLLLPDRILDKGMRDDSGESSTDDESKALASYLAFRDQPISSYLNMVVLTLFLYGVNLVSQVVEKGIDTFVSDVSAQIREDGIAASILDMFYVIGIGALFFYFCMRLFTWVSLKLNGYDVPPR